MRIWKPSTRARFYPSPRWPDRHV